jgi:ABC-type transporter MlaC component
MKQISFLFGVGCCVFATVLLFSSSPLMAESLEGLSPKQIVEKKAAELKREVIGKDDYLSRKRRKLGEILGDCFDFDRLAMATIGDKAKQKTEKQKDRFVKAFEKFFFATNEFVGQVAGSMKGDIEILEERPIRAGVAVIIRISNEAYTNIQVAFIFEKKGNQWLVYDIAAGKGSLIAYYRQEFSGPGSLEQLTKRLESAY